MSERVAVRVRAIREADLPRVWEMIRGLAEFEKMLDYLTGTPEKLAALLFGSPAVMFGRVAEREDGQLVGYALYHHTWSSFRTNARMWLEDLYVAPEARGTGAGAALLRAFVADAHERGCHRVDWAVLEWNPARAFYESQGAARTDAGMLQYGLDRDAMERLIGTK